MRKTAGDIHEPYSRKAVCVLDAACELFIEHGFGETSMDAIASRAGVSKATVYAHHANKKALFAAVARRECRRTTARMVIPVGVAKMPPAAALEHMGTVFLDAVLASDSMALLRLVIAEVPRFPELGEIFYACGPEVTFSGVADYMRRADAHGTLAVSHSERAASQFLGMLRGDLHLRIMLGKKAGTLSVRNVVDEAVHTFLARYEPGG